MDERNLRMRSSISSVIRCLALEPFVVLLVNLKHNWESQAWVNFIVWVFYFIFSDWWVSFSECREHGVPCTMMDRMWVELNLYLLLTRRVCIKFQTQKKSVL